MCSVCQHRRELKNSWGRKLQFFQQTLQISDGISTDSCKFPTEEIMVAQSFNFFLHFPKLIFFGHKFCISLPTFFDNKIFPTIFGTAQNFGEGNCTLTLLVTTPLMFVHQLRLCFQLIQLFNYHKASNPSPQLLLEQVVVV